VIRPISNSGRTVNVSSRCVKKSAQQ
jgi:hypothetical protein